MRKLNNVLEAEDLQRKPFVQRELMLIKVAVDKTMRGELMDLASVFRAKVCDISADTATIETIGRQEKLAQLQELLQAWGAPLSLSRVLNLNLDLILVPIPPCSRTASWRWRAPGWWR